MIHSCTWGLGEGLKVLFQLDLGSVYLWAELAIDGTGSSHMSHDNKLRHHQKESWHILIDRDKEWILKCFVE